MSGLRKDEWAVRAIGREVALPFIERHHYAKGASNTAVALHGLFRADAFFDNECLGVAWWLPPTRVAAESVWKARWKNVLALSRLAIDPSVPLNGATYLLGQSRAALDREAWPVLLTYADDWQGHTGGIYWADNWLYAGKTNPARTYIKDGVLVSRKAGPKTRSHAEMLDMGCECIGPFAKHKFVRLN